MNIEGNLVGIIDSLENGLYDQALEQAKGLLSEVRGENEDVHARFAANAKAWAERKKARDAERAARNEAKRNRKFDVGEKVSVRVNYNDKFGRTRYLTGTYVGETPDGMVKIKMVSTGRVRKFPKEAIRLPPKQESIFVKNNKFFEAVLNEDYHYVKQVKTLEELDQLLSEGRRVVARHTGPFGEDEGAAVLTLSAAFARFDSEFLEDFDSEDEAYDYLEDNVVVLDKNIGQSGVNFYCLNSYSIEDMDLWLEDCSK